MQCCWLEGAVPYCSAELSVFRELRGDSEGFENVGRNENVAVDVRVVLRSEGTLREEQEIAEDGEVVAIAAIVAFDDDVVGTAQVDDIRMSGEHEDPNRFVLLIER